MLRRFTPDAAVTSEIDTRSKPRFQNSFIAASST
jgi:hypothetical protein